MDRRRSHARYTAAWRLACFIGSVGIIYFAFGQLMAEGDISVPGGGSIYGNSATDASPSSSTDSGSAGGSALGRTDDSSKATAPLDGGATQVDLASRMNSSDASAVSDDTKGVCCQRPWNGSKAPMVHLCLSGRCGSGRGAGAGSPGAPAVAAAGCTAVD
jgi:hypothetical protein